MFPNVASMWASNFVYARPALNVECFRSCSQLPIFGRFFDLEPNSLDEITMVMAVVTLGL